MGKDKNQFQSFYNFLEETEGLSKEDMVLELKEQGIDFDELKKKVHNLIGKFKRP